MSKAKIEIRARDVEGTEFLKLFNNPFGDKTTGAPQHLFIIYTDSNGGEMIIRGGPETQKWYGMFIDDVKIIKEPYGSINGKESIDYIQTALRVVIFEGSDSEAQVYFDKMWNIAEGINSKAYDYKSLNQNCNTVVKTLVEGVGLSLKLPQYSDGTNILVPGINAKFRHTEIDRFIKWYANEVKNVPEKLGNDLDQMSNKVGDLFNKYVKFQNQNSQESTSHTAAQQLFQASATNNVYHTSTKTEFSWTDRSTWANSDNGPWTRSFWEKSEPTLAQKQQDLFQNYKPAFANKPFFFKDPFSKDEARSTFVNEPLSFYVNRADPTNALFQKSLEEHNVIHNLRSSVKACLGNSMCSDTVDRLIYKAANTYSQYPSFFLQSEMRMAVDGEARKFFLKESILSSLHKSAELGPWSHPLRNELQYAASHVSPLVLDLNGDGIQLLPYTKGVYFDIDNDSFAERVGWTSPEDGQLARDLNQNGQIDDITELFGDDQISAFFKLSLLDSNGDKVIDENDEDFKELLIWQDKNQNGYSEPEELKTLTEAGIKSISLNAQPDNRVIEGNRISATSTFIYADGRQGEVADVHYHNDDMDSWYQEEKINYKSEENQCAEDKERFRREILAKLSEKIKNPDNVDKGSDWVADLITLEVKKYIEEYNNRKNAALKILLDKIEGLNKFKKAESRQVCADVEKKLEEEANERYTAIKKETRAKLLEEVQSKLDQEKENITSHYTQEFLKEGEALLNTINEQLQTANAATYQTAVNGRWTQAQYDQAVAANKAVYDQIYQAQQNALFERIKQSTSQEIDQVADSYAKEFTEKLDALNEVLTKTEASKLVEETHAHNQSCAMEEKGIRSVLVDQYRKHRDVAKKTMDEFEEAIKQEGNKVYEFFTTKVINQAAFEDPEPAEEPEAEPESTSEPEAKADPQDSTKPDKAFDWFNDEFFTSQQENSTKHENDNNNIKIDPETLFMPLMRGHGKIPALHVAMSNNPNLKDLVVDFMGLKPAGFGDIYSKIVNILYEWAGVSDIAEDARAVAGGANIEARKVAFIEQITGQEFKQLGAAKFVGQHASTAVQRAWDIALMRATKHLLIQGPFTPLFPNGEYSFLNDNTKLNSTLAEILNTSKNFAADHGLGYDFWVQLGYVLVLSANELNTNIDEINAKLSELAGEPVMLNMGTFGLIGDDNANTIKGSSGSDYIKGLAGDDKLYGKAGSDHIEGDEGDDELYGDQGIDRMYGGEGNDRMYGGDGRDFMYGGDGNDEMQGEEGDDHMEGGAGADDMDGGEGTNTLSYGSSPEGVYVNLEAQEGPEKVLEEAKQTGHAAGDKFKNFQNLGGSEYNDYLIGDNQNNYINGEGGDDVIEGLGGDDNLFGATGNDQLLGGDGDDVLTGFEGPDHMDGGSGKDTADYSHPYATRGVKVNLFKGTGVGGHAHDDTYKNVENVRGSKYNDVIQGNNENNILQGLGGDDVIYGEEGDDIIVGGFGEDKLFGESGDDKVYLTGDGDYANGGEGEDTVSYAFSSEPVVVDMASGTGSINIINRDRFEDFEGAQGSQFDDEITGDDKNNKLLGLKGNDIIRGGLGNDVLIGGPGDDALYGEEGNDRIMGDEGKDIIDGGDGVDMVDYSNEEKEGVRIDLEKRTAKGGIAEGDKLRNIEGIVGTIFDDLLIGDQENNLLFGGDGNDELRGGDGSDRLSGGSGNNTLDGGSGIDYASYTPSQEGVHVNLAEGKSSKEGVYEDIYIDIEGVIGSSFNDRIIGDDKNNYLYGGDGDDYINSGAGWSNKISGGNGNNILEGGKARDEFLLHEGSNKVNGGDGEDTVNYEGYGDGNGYVAIHVEECAMRAMNNLLPQYSGQPFTTPIVSPIVGLVIDLAKAVVEKPGGLVDEFISIENMIGTHFDDIIIGDDNNNHLIGTNGNDEIRGGKGDDKIVCGWGSSNLYGEEGNDFFIVKGFPANVDGGEGIDSADFINLPVPIEANLKEGYVCYNDVAGIVKSKLENVEEVKGTNFDDVLYDNDGDNVLAGGKGDDKIYITNGNDFVNGQEGKDTIYLSGGGNKQIWGGGVDSDTFVITKDFQTQNKTSTIIVDFDVGVAEDKIDLRAFRHLKKIEDLRIEQFVQDNKIFAVITIEQEKWISLYNVDIARFDASNFIFANDESEMCSRSGFEASDWFECASGYN